MDFVDVILIVRGDMQINMPRANTPSGWVTFGFHEDLNEATAVADEMVHLMQEFYGT